MLQQPPKVYSISQAKLYKVMRNHTCWSSNTLTTWCEEPTHWKRPWSWERLRAGEKRATEDEMVGWHHWLSRHEFEQTRGDSEGQGSLVCFSPWGCKELDETEQLNTPWYQFSLPLEGLFCYGSRKGRASWGSRIPNQATTTTEVFMSMWTDKYPKWRACEQTNILNEEANPRRVHLFALR